MLDVLMGQADSITIESVDLLSDHAEFFLRRGSEIEAHQAKRQLAGARNWTLRRLEGEGVLNGARALTGEGCRYVFVSTIPAEPLGAIAELAARASSFADYSALLNASPKELQGGFAELAKSWGGAHEAWRLLRQVETRKPDEQDLEHTNLVIAQMLFAGEPDGPVAVLSDLALKLTGVPLTADRLWGEFDHRHVSQNPLWDANTTADLVSQQTARFLTAATDRLFKPPIARQATAEVVEALEHGAPTVMVAGAAGGGKSAVVAAVVTELIAAGAAVLAFRLDAIMDVRSSRQLGDALDLPSSPVVALARAAAGRVPILVVDQLDAVSLASGRSPEVFDVVQELLNEAARLRVQVVLASRTFDIDNDPRLRALADTSKRDGRVVVNVALLEPDEVDEAIRAAGLDTSRLDGSQCELLRLPLNLALFAAVPVDGEALSFSTTRDLLARYWQTKRRAAVQRRAEVQFDRVVDVLLNTMSTRQTLAVPEIVLEAEGLEDDLLVLASENVVVRGDGRVAFFHETLFDFAFARYWVTRGESVLEFLLSSEQELFRRGQVRQVLLYLRDYDRSRFVDEVRGLLTDHRVRYHVQDSVFSILNAIADPSEAEVGLLLELMAPESRWQHRASFAVRTTRWFAALDEAGLIETWLASGDSDAKARAVEVAGAAASSHGARVAQVLSPRADHEHFVRWLAWVVRRSDGSPCRELFELLLEAVRGGRFNDEPHELFMLNYRLGDALPLWGVELLVAWFVDRPGALDIESGRVVALMSTDHALLELLSKASTREPVAFARSLVPYMQRVMALTEHGDDLPRSDGHFSGQIWSSILHDADDALMHHMCRSLRAVGESDAGVAREIVEPLVDDVHAAAQDLLYEALTGAGRALANWSADLLLRGDQALWSGYSDSHYWRTRELLAATAPHMDAEKVEAVETLLISFEPEWEKTHPPARGHGSFELLTALPEERMSEAGLRRVGELRRKFNRREPEPPMGIRGGMVGSPIESNKAERMTDAQWLSAMRKYEDDEGKWDKRMDLKGGAYELSHVLQEATQREPARFTALGLQIDGTYNDNYLSAVLRGLGQSDEALDPDETFNLIRHAAAVGGHERWLAQPLSRLDEAATPDDVVEILIARALGRNVLDEESNFDEAAPAFDDAYTSGLNTVRGGNVWALTRFVAFDVDGQRTALIAPWLQALAADPSADVRSMVGELLRYCLRWQPDAALEAFPVLVSDRASRLMTDDRFSGLVFSVTIMRPELAIPVGEDLLTSDDETLREHGARFLSLVAVEGGHPELLLRLDGIDDHAVRRAVAFILAARVRWTEDADLLERLERLFSDSDEQVREAAATVVSNLRHQPLDRYRALLAAFVASPCGADVSQLLLTLEYAPQPEHELILETARRILATEREALGDIRTGTAADSRHLTQLLLRSYSVVENAQLRSAILDVIDELLEANAYGIADAIEEMAR